MKLFIIGNGFDLGHEMDTAYMNFSTYLENNEYSFWSQLFSPYKTAHVIPTYEYEEKSLQEIFWRDFESNLGKLDNDYFLDQAESQSLNLEGGDIYIEDTLDIYHERNFGHIVKLGGYLRQWIESVEISDVKKNIIN